MSKTLFFVIALTAGAVFAPLNVSHAESIAAQANEAKSVIVSGTGGTRELALGNAFRNAVEQAVGMMVTSESYVKNLKNIEDKIIVGSSGFIETYHILNEKNDVTGYAVTISAVVRKQKLQEKVIETVGDTQPLNGELLFAQQTSLEAQVKLYQDTYEELVHDFVRNGLEYRYEGSPSIEKQVNGRYTITLSNLSVSLKRSWLNSLEKYRAIINDDKIFQAATKDPAYNKERSYLSRCFWLEGCAYTKIILKNREGTVAYEYNHFWPSQIYVNNYYKSSFVPANWILGGTLRSNRGDVDRSYPNISDEELNLWTIGSFKIKDITEDVVKKTSSISFGTALK